jgi:hypothetical protein
VAQFKRVFFMPNSFLYMREPWILALANMAKAMYTNSPPEMCHLKGASA